MAKQNKKPIVPTMDDGVSPPIDTAWLLKRGGSMETFQVDVDGDTIEVDKKAKKIRKGGQYRIKREMRDKFKIRNEKRNK